MVPEPGCSVVRLWLKDQGRASEKDPWGRRLPGNPDDLGSLPGKPDDLGSVPRTHV